MGVNEALVYWNVCRCFPLVVYHLCLHSRVNKKDFHQAHAMIFAICYSHDPSQELTPWHWYEKICDLFNVPQEMTGQLALHRWNELPRIELKFKQEPRGISETYQAVQFHRAVDFMLLMCSEEQYEFVIEWIRTKHDRTKENFSSQEHELQFESCSAFMPEKKTTRSIGREG